MAREFSYAETLGNLDGFTRPVKFANAEAKSAKLGWI